MRTKVILSSPILIKDGTFLRETITERQALNWLWIEEGVELINYCGHQTVKILGLEPAGTREACANYDEALILTTNKRLEFGREYTVDEIEDIGVIFVLITKVTK